MTVQVTVVNNVPEVVITILGAAQEERKEHRPKITKPPETEITEGKLQGKIFADVKADPQYAKWLLDRKGMLKKPILIELAEYLEANL